MLWNIAGRNCPECGSRYAVGDYDFKPNAVAFCCPHCDQDYYGTDARGHLQPSEFECVNCLNTVNMNQMVLRPAAGYEQESATTVVEHPWEVRGENKSTFRARYRTVKASMLRPQELVELPPVQDRKAGHWRFLTCNSLLISFIGFGSVFLIPFMVVGVLGNAPIEVIGSMAGAMGGIVLFGLFVTWLLMLIFGGVTHFFLRLFAQPTGTLTDTYRSVCYAQGVMAMMIVPVCGIYLFSWIGSIWFLVSSILMLMKTHKTSGFATTMAVLILPATFMLLTFLSWCLAMANQIQV